MITSTGHAPEGPWQFDDTVTACFDDMLSRSIPDLAGMRGAVTRAASQFLPQDGRILDLGTSRGDAVADLIQCRPDVSGVACECSEPMLDVARSRFLSSPIEVQSVDLRRSFPEGRFNVILAILVIQFTPIEYRQRIIRSCFDALLPGGALVIVEKVLGNSAYSDEVITGEYLRFKGQSGYSTEDIDRKRLALEGVLVPVTDAWNEDMLRQAGFTVIPFWRWFNFAGWIAVKKAPHAQ